MASRKKQATPALDVADKAGIDYRIHSYEHDASHESYGLEAAEKLGISPGRVFKTLVATTGSELIVGVVPVEAQLDLKALASAVGTKHVAMAEVADAQRSTGYVKGGISPLGQKKSLRTVVDTSARQHDTIYVSAGKRGLEIELASDALVALTRGSFAAIARV